MPQNVIDIFVKNQIDGYALLELTKENLQEMFEISEDVEEDDNTASSPFKQIVSNEDQDLNRSADNLDNKQYISKLLP